MAFPGNILIRRSSFSSPTPPTAGYFLTVRTLASKHDCFGFLFPANTQPRYLFTPVVHPYPSSGRGDLLLQPPAGGRTPTEVSLRRTEEPQFSGPKDSTLPLPAAPLPVLHKTCPIHPQTLQIFPVSGLAVSLCSP